MVVEPNPTWKIGAVLIEIYKEGILEGKTVKNLKTYVTPIGVWVIGLVLVFDTSIPGSCSSKFGKLWFEQELLGMMFEAQGSLRILS